MSEPDYKGRALLPMRYYSQPPWKYLDIESKSSHILHICKSSGTRILLREISEFMKVGIITDIKNFWEW